MTTQPILQRKPRNPASPQQKNLTRIGARSRKTNQSSALSVLVASHAHPRLTKGGAEISAYALYQALKRRPNTDAWFLGCSNGKTEPRAGICITQPFDENEFIYRPLTTVDHFQSANRDPEFFRALDRLITELQPDIFHSHHYAVLGLEMFRRIKEVRPQTKIVLTLHEYIAICHNHGQMVKNPTSRLCHHESLTDCHACFPDIPAQNFFLRKKYYQHFFSSVDRFIAPSQFLAHRYTAWGIPATKISVLENIIPERSNPTPQSPDTTPIRKNAPTRRLRIGYFGQMSSLKGIKLLAQAAKTLHARDIQGIFFDVFGDYSNQPLNFQEEVEQVLNDKDLTSNFQYHGAYDNEDVHKLMQTVDIVVVPSIWWENSPVVIQEAFANRRPVLCSDIGGMAEKVRPNLDGWHFRAGDSSSLATLLEDLLANPNAINQVHKTLTVPASAKQRLRDYLDLYNDVCRTDC